MSESPEVEVALPLELIGTVAVVWMFGVAVFLGTQVWSALSIGRRFGLDGPDTDNWLRMTFLSQTGSLLISLGAMAGLVLVALAGPAVARAASVLGIAIGLWTAVAGALGVIVAFHKNNNPLVLSSLTDNRLVFGLARRGGHRARCRRGGARRAPALCGRRPH